MRLLLLFSLNSISLSAGVRPTGIEAAPWAGLGLFSFNHIGVLLGRQDSPQLLHEILPWRREDVDDLATLVRAIGSMLRV